MNLKLDSSGDLIIGRGAARVEGAAYVGQLIANKLKTLYGEWQLNTTLGIPWFTDLLVHNPNEGLIYNWIFKTLNDIEYVTSVDNLVLGIVKSDRKLLIHFEVTTIYGSITKEVEV